MKTLIAFAFGLLFGVGLLVSGMTDPARVLGFLDIVGRWDPSLAFVMGGAVLTAAPIFALARRSKRPLFAKTFDAPESMRIDASLVGGAAAFGVGWGLAGLCPGPALVDLGLNPVAAWLFVLALAVGLAIGRGARRLRSTSSAPAPKPASASQARVSAERVYYS